MSLILCPFCGKNMQHNMTECPWCHKEKPSYGRNAAKIAFFLFIGAMLWLFFVNDRQEQTTAANNPSTLAPRQAVENSAWDGTVYQVEKYLKKNLKDPDSYTAIEWGMVGAKDNGFTVRVKYRAKNSYGGYVVEHKLFTLDKSGNIVGVTDWNG